MPITIINDLFNVGVFVPIIFGINFVIPTFKMRFQSKLLGKVIAEALIPKSSCIHFMVVPHLTLSEILTAVESKHIVACHKMVINTLFFSLFHYGLSSVYSDHMTQHDVTSQHQKGRNLKEDGSC